MFKFDYEEQHKRKLRLVLRIIEWCLDIVGVTGITLVLTVWGWKCVGMFILLMIIVEASSAINRGRKEIK